MRKVGWSLFGCVSKHPLLILFVLGSLFLIQDLVVATATETVRETSVESSAPTEYKIANNGDVKESNPVQPLSPSTVFTNAAAITIPDDGVTGATSNISVSGMSGPISSLTLTLNNLTTPRPQHMDMLLVGPGGQKFVFLSDAGGQNTGSATSNVTMTFSDASAVVIQQAINTPFTSGTFRPVDYDFSVNFPTSSAPYQHAPPFGAASFGSVFGGLSGASVNGNWTLHIFDPQPGPFTTQNIAGGWSLNVVTTPAAVPTTTVLSSSANPSFTNQAITLTATVTSTSTVNTGVVNFVDNTTSTTLCSSVAVNGSGVAICNVPANTLTERIHQITATYVGNVTFATSNSSISQEINNPTQISGTMFTNPGTIVVSDTSGILSVPYPSNIFVSGLTGTISKVTVSLLGVNFPETGDLDFLLVGPGGQRYVFWSDAGGGASPSTGTFILDDTAATQLPASGSIAAGTYRPTDYSVESDVFPAPAPSGPYSTAAPTGGSTFASVFGGAAPNGKWSLYATDDAGSGGLTSSIAGWRLTFTTSGDAPTTTVLTSSPNPSTTAQAILFTAAVTSTSTVNSGTVTFRRGTTILCNAIPVNGSGVATCNVTAGTIPQGTHVITADYNGSPGQFNISNGTTTQQVDSPTIVTCLNFANNGGVTVSNASTLGNPYPSNINVTGLGGTISKVTLTMNIASALTPDHNDFLLVGPGGQKFLFMGDAGGNFDIINQTITLDDAAATPLPDNALITSGTYRPASYTGDPDVFPAPAPAAPFNQAAPEGAGTFAIFNGISPNGTWRLFAVEDAGDGADTVINNWSLTFTLAPTATTTAVTSSADPSVFGQPITFTATVTANSGIGIPSGSVQFLDGATPIGSPVALNGSGVATLIVSNLSVGNHTISAQYSGAGAACNVTFNASTGNMIGNPQVVNKANTTTGLASSQNPTLTGQPVTFNATVGVAAPGVGSPSGSVTFLDNGNPIAGCQNISLSAGAAQCTTSNIPAGSRTITAQYNGDLNFNTSNGSLIGNPLVVSNTAVLDGSFNSDWTTNFVPTAAHNVNIPSGGVPNQPTFGSGTTLVNDLTVGSGRSLSIENNSTIVVNGLLTMSGNNIDATNGLLSLTTNASVLHQSGHILGDVEKAFDGTGLFFFPVGTSTGFSPVQVNITALASVPSSLMVRANDGTVAPLSDATTLDRYWTLTEVGDLTADVTFNYLQSDVDGNEASYRTTRVIGGSVTVFPNGQPCPGVGSPCVDASANTIFVGGLQVFSDWTASELAPTAAAVTVSGRVLTPEGRGLSRAVVTMMGADGTVRLSMSSAFGYFRFFDVPVGETYILSVRSKRYTFEPQVHNVMDEITDISFVAEPRR
jgi:subtilisin-like proprotein convertase family protein